MASKRFDSKLMQKKQLTDVVFEYVFSAPEDFTFVPGQFVSVAVQDILRRSYSILEVKNSTFTLVVDISPGGPGSQFFENVKEGDITDILGPVGFFAYKKTPLKKVFVATGTGIVPFIPMIKELLQEQPETEIEVYFGTRFKKENFAYSYLDEYLNQMNGKIIRCISKLEEESTEECVRGRVTKVIPEQITDFSNTEFYLCGVSQMVIDMEALLHEKQVPEENIIFEKYG